ncbi:MAG: hypothetical protein COW71_09685 [Ignavibacteriales bacterium CG18_big_fil_WC_8_21_14_2_50_31_20]|nr:MAG: hypothetical protein COW71_09685 [Ignavibacteriales bacterium CG18_big_fil_WC_8_21_14_2_50_31_20]
MKTKLNFFFTAILLTFMFSSSVLSQNWSELSKNLALDKNASDYFGNAVSISGDYAIVGAKGGDYDAAGQNLLSQAGAAYILKYNSGSSSWEQVQKLVSSDRESGDAFGYSVSINGEFAIVGAYTEGQNDLNGNPASSFGAAYVFKLNISTGIWEQKQKLVAFDRYIDDYYGQSVDINGNYAIVGAPFEEEPNGIGSTENSGSVYIYKFNATSQLFEFEQKIVSTNKGAGDQFGTSISISETNLLVGKPHDWNGSTFYGRAELFQKGTTWTHLQYLQSNETAEDDNFGYSVSIDGNYSIIGAKNETGDAFGNNPLNLSGASYIFKNNSGTWSQVQKIVASDRGVGDYFGTSVSISGDYSVIGAFAEDHDANGANYLNGSGSVYIYHFNSTSAIWELDQKIVSSDRATSDNFGFSVSIDGTNIISGAYKKTESTLTNAGASYIFNNSSILPVELTSFTANHTDVGTVLTWQTATEVNNYGFEIERSSVISIEGRNLNWEKIGFIEGHGNSNSPKDYSFLDDKNLVGLDGELQYRLKQIDFDGNYEYSDVVEVKLNENIKAYKLEQNYPNPFNPTTTIKYSIPNNVKGETSNVKLIVYDILGSEVATLVNEKKSAGNYEVKFDASNLVSGVYLYKLQSGSFVQTKKLLLMK